jgi:hypothetical protein
MPHASGIESLLTLGKEEVVHGREECKGQHLSVGAGRDTPELLFVVKIGG